MTMNRAMYIPSSACRNSKKFYTAVLYYMPFFEPKAAYENKA